MSVNERDLKVAEMLNSGATYEEIETNMREKGTPISRQTISGIKKMIDDSTIAFSDQGVAREKEPKAVRDIHQEIIGVVTKQAAEEAVRFAEEDYKLGRELRQYWFLKAQEKNMSLREYVKAALIFFDDYKDVAAENEDLRKIARSSLEALSANTIRRKRLDLYYKFISDMIKLKAQGLIVPPQVVTDFYNDLEYLSKEGTIPMKEVFTSVNETET